MAPEGGPTRITPERLADYFEVMTKAVFQSGISWRVVEAKWDGFRKALKGFDPSKVADLTPRDVDRLAEDPSIIRNRKKIEATVENAETMLALDREHKGFREYLRSHGGFEETVADLRRRFRFLGDTGCYYFLYVVGEKVPGHEQWAESRGVDPGTMRSKRAR
jgi:DNA-3-methyladenine glycosylase I